MVYFLQYTSVMSTILFRTVTQTPDIVDCTKQMLKKHLLNKWKPASMFNIWGIFENYMHLLIYLLSLTVQLAFCHLQSLSIHHPQRVQFLYGLHLLLYDWEYIVVLNQLYHLYETICPSHQPVYHGLEIELQERGVYHEMLWGKKILKTEKHNEIQQVVRNILQRL